MAKTHEVIEETLGVSVRWPPATELGDERDAEGATFGWLRLSVGNHLLTRFRSDNGQEGDEVQVPLYHVAEWIALNWWALLYEPKKKEDAEQDFEFRARHWLGVARNGFALPDTWIIPAGGKIEISSFARHLSATRLRFTETARADVSAPQVREALAGFVGEVFQRLRMASIQGTLFEETWAAILSTPPEAEEFCRLMGALGLSPYDDHPQIEALLDHLSSSLDTSLLRDLCEAGSASTLARVADVAATVWGEISSSPVADLSRLSGCPSDSTSERAAKWGLDAAFEARKRFGIRMADPEGGNAFFDAIKLPPSLDNVPLVSAAPQLGLSDSITGAVDRHDDTMRFALVQEEDVARRRFAGARAAFLAWSGRAGVPRLMTDARTRDQQASRAFAAEILAPVSFIKSKATNGVLSLVRSRELSQILGVSSAVIENQAKNAGLYVQGTSPNAH